MTPKCVSSSVKLEWGEGQENRCLFPVSFSVIPHKKKRCCQSHDTGVPSNRKMLISSENFAIIT